jgi:hypothetical protein
MQIQRKPVMNRREDSQNHHGFKKTFSSFLLEAFILPKKQSTVELF